MTIKTAQINDAEAILSLQKLCYQSEARITGDYGISPLKQVLAGMQSDINNMKVFAMWEDNKIIGSIRASEKDGICYIGRIIVHPDMQNQGRGKILINTVEKEFAHCKTFELFTSSLSERNLYLYNKLGYKIYKKEKAKDNYDIIYLRKKNSK